MPSTDFDLARLLRPEEPEAFFRATWEKQPLAVSRANPDYYRGLFALRDVDEVIAFTRPRFLDPGDLQPGVPEARSFVQGWLPDDEPFPVAVYAGVAEVHQAYARGKTVILRSMQQRWPPLAALCRRLEGVFGCPVHANMYLTPPGAQGFAPHHDTHEVFVLQVEGFKHWRLYGPARALPLEDDRAPVAREQIGPPTREVRLEAGDLLYIPRGHVHEAFTSACASLHLTVGIRVFRWLDLLGQALAGVADRDVRFREALPVGWLDGGDPAALRAGLRQLLRVLAESARADEAVERLASDFLASLPGLPGGWFAPGPDAEGIELDTVLEKAPGVICRVVRHGDRAAIEYPGNRVEGPARIATALHFIARTPRFTARSLPDGLTEKARLVLVRRLVRDRLLAVAALPAPDVSR
jgi:hypothetical protein